MISFLKGTVTPADWIFVAVAAVITVVLCAAFYFFVFIEQQEKQVAINSEIEELQRELNIAYETKRNIEDLRLECAALKDLKEQFEKRLPSERDIPRLLYQFEELGDKVGLSVKLDSLPTIKENNKETIPYDVTAYGNFHQVVSFINLLERDNRYFKISDLDIGEEVAGISETRFTLSTFRLLQSESEKKAESTR